MAGNSPARAQSSTPAAPTPPSTVLRVTLAVFGGAALIFGTVAVFSAASGAGAVALLLAGLILVAAAIFLPMYSSTLRLGGGRAAARSDVSAVAGLLTSPDPLVRLAAAEAVLDPAPSADEPAPDIRELAIGVLLERDLVRRVSDLLSRGGYRVVSTGIGAHRSGADVLIAVDDKVLLPVMVNTGSGLDSIAAVQSFSAVANGLASQAAVVIFTGPQAGSPPLGTATTVGGVQVFSVYSPRLGDEPSVQAAVGRALEAAKPAKSLSAKRAEPASSPASPDPAHQESTHVTEDADSH